jgi:hypothetical protein
MGRPFYPYETDDPDLDWLISNFLYERPEYYPIEVGILPVVLIPHDEELFEDEEGFHIKDLEEDVEI